jgi:FMN phosphatase YigB (HAD superfamily)
MIRVVMFDLGLTLLDANDQPFPHVKEALSTIASFKTADGKKLRSCLVSDFEPPDPPVTPAKIKAKFAEYLAILDGAGLRSDFEPTAKRVTLSIHAGVFKPDRKIFEKALQRLGVSATLKECLFITENAAHIRAARQTLKMKTLQFRSSDSAQFDFDDWAKAPKLIANLLAS